MSRLFAFLFAAALIHAAQAEFLVGSGGVGDRVVVLCEESDSAYVSLPSGGMQTLTMDARSQAYFVPEYPGPHSVQCGARVKTVEVGAAGGIKTSLAEQDSAAGALAVGATAAMLLAFLAAAALLAQWLLRRTVFVKTVENGRTRLILAAGKNMREISITDPEYIGFEGRAATYSIPSLAAGKSWSWECETEKPGLALPASLIAKCDDGKISMLSQLIIGDEKGGGARQGRLAMTKRALPKAP